MHSHIAARLAAHYPVLYTGKHGRVAHECILDQGLLRGTVDDVAKRLID
jgi:glycine dehydrogenase